MQKKQRYGTYKGMTLKEIALKEMKLNRDDKGPRRVKIYKEMF